MPTDTKSREKAAFKKIADFVLEYKFMKLFSVPHNLNDEHKTQLQSVIEQMLTVTPGFRIPLIRALSIVEGIIIQRQTASLPQTEQDIYLQTLHSAQNARRDLAKNVGQETLDDLDDDRDQSTFEQFCVKVLNENLSSNTHIKTFIDFVNVKLFANCSTVAEIKDACSKVFIDHKIIYKQLDQVRQTIESLKELMKQHKLYDIARKNKLNEIRQMIGICLNRKAEMPLTLDYLAEFNRKCTRDILEAQFRLEGLEHEVNAEIQRRQRVHGSGNPSSLFAQNQTTARTSSSVFGLKR